MLLNGSDKIVVLIDGVRANINGSESTYSKMATAELSDIDSIECIEVLKSLASTSHFFKGRASKIALLFCGEFNTGAVKKKIAAASLLYYGYMA